MESRAEFEEGSQSPATPEIADHQDQPVPEFELKWKVRLSNGHPERLLIVIAIAFVAGAAGLELLGHPIFAVIGFAIILASTTEVWWGTTYQVGPAGASVTNGFSKSAIEWKDVKRVIRSDSEMTLSPLVQDSRLSPFRGITLRFGDQEPETVWQAVAKCGGEHVRELG